MYDSASARIVRKVTETYPHTWCAQYGWHDESDHADNDDETYTRAAQREADLTSTGE